jgi:hypothetical protein
VSSERLKAFFTGEPPRFGKEGFAALVCELGVHCTYIEWEPV